MDIKRGYVPRLIPLLSTPNLYPSDGSSTTAFYLVQSVVLFIYFFNLCFYNVVRLVVRLVNPSLRISGRPTYGALVKGTKELN